MARGHAKVCVFVVLSCVTVFSVLLSHKYIGETFTYFADVTNISANWLRISTNPFPGVQRDKSSSDSLVLVPHSFYNILMTSAHFHSVTTEPNPNPITSLQIDKNVLVAGCKIPHHNPFDKIVMQLMKRLSPPNCKREPALVIVKGDEVTLNGSLLAQRKETLINCTYEVIIRVNEQSVNYSKPIVFNSTARPTADFVRVKCFTKDTSSKKERSYKALVSIIAEKPDLEALLDNRTAAMGSHADDGHAPMSIVMVGLDSVSQFSMYRHLNLTRHILMEHMQAIELVNYNKVGLNTFPNLIPMMTGRSASMIPNVRSKPLDTINLTFVWNELERAGYRTMFSEDSPDIAIFNFAATGFKDPPAHYYYRTFEKAKQGNTELFTSGRQCFGTQPADELILNYTLEFQRVFRNKPHFGLTFLTTSTHDNANGASQIDDYHARFQQSLMEEGMLNNTLFIFFSDHGMRWGSVRNTKQGEFEDNRPFMFLVFPPWFRQKQPDVLQRIQMNSVRLLTPFDIHATLRDVAGLRRLDSTLERVPPKPSGSVGISLFDEIPADRTCAHAGIPLLFCVCLKNRPLNASSPPAQQSGAGLVKALNKAMTKVTKVCHVLELKNVSTAVEIEQGWQYVEKQCIDWNNKTKTRRNNNATIRKSDGNSTAESNSTSTVAPTKSDSNSTIALTKTDWNSTLAYLYRITIFTKPGEGKFDAMVAKCSDSSEVFVFGDIDRTNQYGNTSHCVKDTHLKKMCYCRDL